MTRRQGVTLAELLVGVAIGLALVAVVWALLWLLYGSAARIDAEAGASLELTELLEHLCHDLRAADDLSFEEQQGVTTLRFSRRAGHDPGETAVYVFSAAGRKAVRRSRGGRERAYDFTRGQAETDPLMVELSPDRRVLYARGLGFRLELPSPEARRWSLPAAGEEAAASGSDPRRRADAALAEVPVTFGFGPSGAATTPVPVDTSAAEATLAFLEPAAIEGAGLEKEADAHPLAVLYRFAGGGDETPVPGADPDGRRFGIYESRSNLPGSEPGAVLVFLRGSRGAREPPEPMYVLPDPSTGRLLAGGTPDADWPGVGSGPGAIRAGKPSSASRSAGEGGREAGPETGEPSGTAADARAGRQAPDDRLTLDRAIADAITGDDAARGALIDTLRNLRGLPPGTDDEFVQQVAGGVDRAREAIDAQRAQTGTDPEGEFGPLSRTTSIERQVLRNLIRKEQGLDGSEEEAAAREVDRLRQNPGVSAPAPAAEVEPAPAPVEPPQPVDGK